jgi:N utilization substance protein B
MTYKRSELREKAMIILYQIDICIDRKLEYDIDYLIKTNLEIDNEFVKNIVYGVTTYKDSIDEIANKYMNKWTIDRLDKTGAAILRMAIYELKYTDTPEVVIINEAVELSKKYSDDSVRKMINAVLDKCIKE